MITRAWLQLIPIALVALCASACSTEGTTPNCPDAAACKESPSGGQYIDVSVGPDAGAEAEAEAAVTEDAQEEEDAAQTEDAEEDAQTSEDADTDADQ